MKKEHSVFITLTFDEAIELLKPVLKRRGWLKDVPNEAECELYDDANICIEYHWDEVIE